MNHSPFMFETEFASNGEVLRGPDRKYFSREESDQMAASARAEGEARARQTAEAKGHAAIDKAIAHLSPVQQQLAAIADSLRQEAAELALIAARKIAGAALDAAGEAVATKAIADVISQLKGSPVITVSVAPDSLQQVEKRLEQTNRLGPGATLRFVADARARPGDWRVSWSEGSTGFSREAVEAAIEASLAARLQDPVEPQLELFAAA